jgi:hypothetical protein
MRVNVVNINSNLRTINDVLSITIYIRGGTTHSTSSSSIITSSKKVSKSFIKSF